MKLTVTKTSKKSDSISATFDVKDSTTVEELKELVSKEFKVTPNSQGLKFPSPLVAGADKEKASYVRLNKLLETIGDLKKQGLSEATPIELKNLGTQLPYRWLFLSEYFGPIPIMIFFSLRPELVYGPGVSQTLPLATTVAVWAYILHFVKRELETLFVHKFSKPSVPLDVFVRNNLYYSGFAAAVSYFICHPAASTVPDNFVGIFAGGMAVMELGNLAVHLWFAMQRKRDKDASRPIPSGALFFVSCPNYFFEVAAWAFFSVLVNNHPAAWAFTAAGALQMGQWAMEKHRAYIQQEKAERTAPIASQRSAMIPFLF